MGDLKFALWMMKRDKGNALLYILSIAFSIAALFNMFTMNFNNDFTDGRGPAYLSISGMTIVVIFVAAMFMFLGNLYLIANKCKEFGILILSGRSIVDVTMYIIWQNVILTTIGTILGFILGIALLPVVNNLLYKAIGEAPLLFQIGPKTIGVVITLIILQYLMAVAVSFGYVRQREISDLVVDKDKMYSPDNRLFKMNPIIYFIIFILLLLYPFINRGSYEDKFTLSTMLIMLDAVVVQAVIRLFIPKAIEYLKKKKFAFNKIMVITLSNLHYAMRKSAWLVIALLCANTVLVYTVGVGYTEKVVIKAATINFFGVISLLAIMITYKILIEAMGRKSNFKQLLLLGYNKIQIKKIIKSEVIWFFIIILLVTFPQVITAIVMGNKAGFIEIGNACFIIFSSLGIYLIAGLITYFYYKKMIMDYIENF